jgi:hypothetical protein
VLRSELAELLGAGNFSLTYAWREDKFTLTLDLPLDITDDQLAQVRVLLGCIPPRNLVTEMYWADGFPMNFTRLEYLGNTGTQYLVLPVVFGETSGISLNYKVKPYSNYSYLSMIRYGEKSIQLGRIYDDEKTGVSTSNPTASLLFANIGKIFISYNEYETKKMKIAAQGTEKEKAIPHLPAVGESVTPVYLMAYDASSNLGVYNPSKAYYSLYEARFTLGQKLSNRYIPALDNTGVPCMFDTETRTPCYNRGTGLFVAGVETQKQLDAVLRGLPDRTGQDGGELHLSLSDALYESAVASGIIESTATAKNWQIAYDPTTEIAA